MKKKPSVLLLLILTTISFNFCEQEDPQPEENQNPFKKEEGWDGFILNGKAYSTPHAVIEIWGENLDSLSSDYDISFTDGSFDFESRNITDDSIRLYFDANSPSLDEFSPGTYHIESTTERKPGNIVDAYLQITGEYSVNRYPILSGTVTVEEENGFYSISYDLKSIVNSEITSVTGSYSGMYTIIDQTALK